MPRPPLPRAAAHHRLGTPVVPVGSSSGAEAVEEMQISGVAAVPVGSSSGAEAADFTRPAKPWGSPAVPVGPRPDAEAVEVHLESAAAGSASLGAPAVPVGSQPDAEAVEVHLESAATPMTPRASGVVDSFEVPAEAAVGDSDAALVAGVWQTDASQHAAGALGTGLDATVPSVRVPTPEGSSTLRVAYFFAGVKRKASLAEALRSRCVAAGLGLIMFEIDILVGGSGHDLLDSSSQRAWLARIGEGEFDICIFSPPCGSWSRANFAGGKPYPCRDRWSPWGFKANKKGQKKRAETGSIFVRFTIEGIATAADATRRGKLVRSLAEHPEDLGATHRGVPASIWQLDNLRSVYGQLPFCTVAGH